MTTLERTGRWISLSPAGGIDDRSDIIAGGDIRFPPPEYNSIVHCNKAHYGPVSGGGAAAGVKGVHYMVGSRRLGLGGDADRVSQG